MAAEPVAIEALNAGRPKVYFPAWRRECRSGITPRRCTGFRYVSVGFSDHIPNRPNASIEFLNADVFLSSGPRALEILAAYLANDLDRAEEFLLQAIFASGPGYWMRGTLHPDPTHHPISEEARQFGTGTDILQWSGLDRSYWQKTATTEPGESLSLPVDGPQETNTRHPE